VKKSNFSVANALLKWNHVFNVLI